MALVPFTAEEHGYSSLCCAMSHEHGDDEQAAPVWHHSQARTKYGSVSNITRGRGERRAGRRAPLLFMFPN